MRIKFLTILFVVIVAQINAQNTSSSPYTSFGFGEKGNIEHSVFTGIGNSTVTYFDSTIINFYNPSTYNTLGQGQPLFSLGVTSRLSDYTQNDVSQFKSAIFIEHFAMAFTIKNHFGLAFGLKPFSKKGYSITEKVQVGTDSLQYTYFGTGGSNEVFLGLSTDILKLKYTRLSIGTNLSYIFGASTNERRSQLVGNGNGGVDYQTIRMNSLHYEFGAFFKQTLRENHDLTLALVLEPGQTLKGTQDDYLFSGIVVNPNSYDTLYASVGQKGHIQLAPTITVGLNYNFKFTDAKKNNTLRNSELAFHVNYSTTDWTKYSSTFYAGTNLLATSKLTFGIQYIPEYKFLEKATNSKFLEKVRYRAGYYQYTLPYAFNGIQLKDFGTTFGIGIPILGGQSLSSVNLGVSLGKRETNDANSLNEKYIGVSFGVILAPSSFDRWFRKRKLD